MSTKVKERLKKMVLELDHYERVLLDEALVLASGRSCDDAIEKLTDDQVRAIVIRIKKKKKKIPRMVA